MGIQIYIYIYIYVCVCVCARVCVCAFIFIYMYFFMIISNYYGFTLLLCIYIYIYTFHNHSLFTYYSQEQHRAPRPFFCPQGRAKRRSPPWRPANLSIYLSIIIYLSIHPSIQVHPSIYLYLFENVDAPRHQAPEVHSLCTRCTAKAQGPKAGCEG